MFAFVRLLALACAALPLAAAPALTTIQDTLYRADGSRFNGTVFVQWKSFDTAQGAPVPTNSVTVRVTDGVLHVSLAPTTTAGRPAWYHVRYNSDGRTDFTEFWSVPPSAASLRLRDVRIPGPLSVTTPVPPVNTAILIADIAGLRDELDVRPLKASGYVPGRVAIVNAEGEIESALGDAADCVRVDGSSGPCGGGGVAYADAEAPAELPDGVRTTFTLEMAPMPAVSLRLYRNGLLLRMGLDYRLEGAAVTFEAASVPAAGDSLQAWYRYPDAGAAEAMWTDMEVPVGVVDGVNPVFWLNAAPAPPTSLQVYRNGLLLSGGVDYDLSGQTITFRPGAAPAPGDVIGCWYRN